MNLLVVRSMRQLTRLVAVAAMALWVAELDAAKPAECGDEFCEHDVENCSSCELDCGECSECGDNECQSAWPEIEDCTNCTEDCESMCLCGDSNCDYPAEGAGEGDSFDCQFSGNPECSLCIPDCGSCSTMWCALVNENACHWDEGVCGQCDEFTYPCHPGYWCTDGSCVPIGR
jgi:hypothetical protein